METSLAQKIPYVRRWDPRETGTVASLVVGLLLVTVGSLLAIFQPGGFTTGRLLAVAAGLLIIALGLDLSRPLDALSLATLTPARLASPSDQLRQWSRFKTLVVALTLATALTLGVLVFALAVRLGLPWGQGLRDHAPFDGALALLTIGNAIVLTLVLGASFRTDYQRHDRPFESHLTLGTIVVAGLFAIAGVVVASQTSAADAGIKPSDAPFLVLAASAAVMLLAYPTRSLPGPLRMLTDERRYYDGHVHLTLGKSTVLPIALSLAVLLPFGFGVLLMETGLGAVMVSLSNSQLAKFGLGVFLVGVVSSAGGSAYLLYREERVPLYHTPMDRQTAIKLGLVAVSALLTLVFSILAVFVFLERPIFGLEIPKMRWVDLTGVAILCAVGPYGFHAARQARRNRKLEERLPEFLRDLAAGRKAGLTLEDTVVMSAQGDYGELTPEIRKMADQLSWNMPFSEALEQFRERVSTPLVDRAVSVINEANRTGGNVTAVLEAVAQDAREIKELQSDRRSTMVIYTAIIYIAFFVYLGVIAVLFHSLIPQILTAAESVAAQGGQGFTSISSGLTLADYRTFYFVAALAQATGNGLVSGLFESGNMKAGLKHTFIMVLSSLVVFMWLT